MYLIKIFQFFLELSKILFLPVDRCMTNEPEENEGLILTYWDFSYISTSPWYIRDENWEPEYLRRHESFLSEIKTSFTSRDAFEDLEREKDIVPLKIWCQHCTKMFSITDFFSKCDQIRSLRIWSHLLKNSVMEKLCFFCALQSSIKKQQFLER